MKLCLGTFFETFMKCSNNIGRPAVFTAFFKDLLIDAIFGDDSMYGIMKGRNNAVRQKNRHKEMRRNINKQGLLAVQSEMWKRVNVLIAPPMFETFLYTLAHIVQADDSINMHTSLNIGEEPIKTFGQLRIEDYETYVTSIFLYAALNTDNDEAGGVHEITPEYLANCTEIMQKGTASSQRIEPANAQIPVVNTWCPLKNRAQARLDKAYFHGREELIAEIRARLEQHRNSPVFLWGVGGIGKTALACHYAVYEAKQYQVFFTTYSNSFKETIAKLELRNSDGGSITSSDMTVDQRYEIHMQALRKCTADIVLIIDNADSGTDLTSQDEYSELCLLDMQFIITTRNNMQGDGRALYVGELSDDDYIKLMLQYYPSGKCHIDELCVIAEVLQHHTLAIELISKSMEESCGALTPEIALDHLSNADSIDGDEWEPVQREYGANRKEMKTIEHLSAVFKMASLPVVEKHILGSFALIDESLRNEELRHLWSSEDARLIKQLNRRGWLLKDNSSYFLHPVIRYVVLTNRMECISWIGNQKFILSVLGEVDFLNRRARLGFYPRSNRVVGNLLKAINHETIPPVYRGLIYCCYIRSFGLSGPPRQRIMIDELLKYYDLALACYEDNEIGRYLVFDAFIATALVAALFTKEVDEATVRRFEELEWDSYAFCASMRCTNRSDYVISEELSAFLERRVEVLLSDRDTEFVYVADVETGEPRVEVLNRSSGIKLQELLILYWLLGNNKLELDCAQRVKQSSRASVDWFSYACAQLHSSSYDESAYKELLDLISRICNLCNLEGYSLYAMSYSALNICERMGWLDEATTWRRMYNESSRSKTGRYELEDD